MPQYIGIRYQQAEGAPLVSFVALAEEIKSWTGVPHKTSDFVGGFQRPLNERYRKIVDFFDEAGNSSPTAIVVAFRPGDVHISSLPSPPNWPKVETGIPEMVLIDIPDEFDTTSLEQMAERVCAKFASRLKQEGRAPRDHDDDPANESDDSRSDGIVSAASDEELDAPVPEESEEEDEWGIDVGQSALVDFVSKIETPAAIAQFKREIAARMVATEEADGFEEANVKAENSLREVLESLLRPAMIVDGQHRVYGASLCESDVSFTVVGIEDADWGEQVFQFVVINKQARAISGEFLASIVNSSLTNREIRALETRLDASGLSTHESKMLRLMNDNPDSPFASMVSRGLEEKDKRKITFKAAMAITNRWKRRMNDRDVAYKTLFREKLPGANYREKAARWNEVWSDYMFAFWNGLKNLYQGEQLWDPGTQLMFRATLEVLQENFLETKARAGMTYDNPVKLREDVEEFYRNVPSGFFHTEWKRKELLTDDGQTVLKKALNEMRVPGAKLKSLIKSDPLFTGATTKPPRKG